MFKRKDSFSFYFYLIKTVKLVHKTCYFTWLYFSDVNPFFIIVRSSIVRFLQFDEGLKFSTIVRICKIYGDPMLYHNDQIREPNNQLTYCYGFPQFNMYGGLYFDFPQCLTGQKYTNRH